MTPPCLGWRSSDALDTRRAKWLAQPIHRHRRAGGQTAAWTRPFACWGKSAAACSGSRALQGGCAEAVGRSHRLFQCARRPCQLQQQDRGDLVTDLKSNAQKGSFGSAGIGKTSHLMGELLSQTSRPWPRPASKACSPAPGSASSWRAARPLAWPCRSRCAAITGTGACWATGCVSACGPACDLLSGEAWAGAQFKGGPAPGLLQCQGCARGNACFTPAHRSRPSAPMRRTIKVSC